MPDTPVEPNAGGPYPSGLETRVSRLEGEVHEVRATMGRLEMMLTELKATLDATLPHLVTKADVAEFRTELKGDMAGLRTELKSDMAGLRTELKGDMADLRTELKGNMAGLRTELRGETAGLRTELKGEMAGLRTELKGEMGDLRVSLAQMPTKTYMWGILTALLTAYACGLAALAILK